MRNWNWRGKTTRLHLLIKTTGQKNQGGESQAALVRKKKEKLALSDQL